MRKIFIVGGGGTIGSCTASAIAGRGLADELIIFDMNRDMAESHAIDISQSIFDRSPTRVRAGTWDDLAGATMVIIAAGLPAKLATHDYCKDICALRPLMDEICTHLRADAPGAVVLSMTNPLDVFNYALWSASGLPARQFIALSQNDSLRFRWALAEELGVSPARCGGFVLGEHGPGKLPMFSTATLDGEPLALTGAQKDSVLSRMSALWAHFLQVSGARTAGWTSGAAAAQVAEAVFSGGELPMTCSYIREEAGVSFGGAAYLNEQGVAGEVPMALTADEKAAVAKALAAMRATTDSVMAYCRENG